MKASLLAIAALLSAPAIAQTASVRTPPPPAATTKPKLVVVVSVDQLSADLFAQYRRHFTGGFARLLSGGVFPAGYQGHAATETCPGHSTITTGARPSRTGIIANDWTDFKAPRDDKSAYCAEDERLPGSTSTRYTVSDVHLRVPSLGERMHLADPNARVVSVAGKDRAAVMMGGHAIDQAWWWDGKAFVSYAGRTAPAIVNRTNAMVAARIAEPQAAMDLPAICQAHDYAVPIGGGKTVGTGRFARAAGDARAFRASPEIDEATLAMAAGLVEEMKLGQGASTDIISVGASANDFVGHTYGTQGSETCIQLLALDQYLGQFFAVLDRTKVDYVVALTADHGGIDLPERQRMSGVPDAARVDPALNATTIGTAIAAKLGLKAPLLFSSFGDLYLDPALTRAQHDAALAEAVRRYKAHPQVYTVLTRADIAATPMPTTSPDAWTLLERARASFDAQRSGDLTVVLRPHISPIADPTKGYVTTHGSVWDYDRRVPILFWRRGMSAFEQPMAVETADIMPTLAALIGLSFPAAEVDGRCRDLDPGPASTCPAR